jgi:hypothetical protein
MMRTPALLTALLVLSTPALVRAQEDSAPLPPRRAEQLRQMIEQRFTERVKEALGLTDDQAARMRGVQAMVAEKRRMLEMQERQVRMALGNQLRPGIAANADSVAKLVNALTAQRVAFAQTFQDEMRELSTFLTPVQRGQYLLMRDRLMMQIEELRRSTQQQMRPGRNRPPF